ncbi:hypothetical protein HC864_01840 [Candidatus Gracilibacteria bacterium]|nr:hypothetical protein [Candidatus Gracilibacteria bacterium]
MTNSVFEDRKQPSYRRLEATLGITSLFFISLIIILSIFAPTLASLILITYSFMWLMKYSLNVIYTITTYKRMKRWQSIDIFRLLELIETDFDQAKKILEQLAYKYKNKIEWKERIDSQINQLSKNLNSKFAKPSNVFHICNFAIYNESAKVLQESLQRIYECNYNLSNVLVIVSQEERIGEEFNCNIRKIISDLRWTQTHNINEIDHKDVLSKDLKNLKYSNLVLKKIHLSSSKLNIVFTQHPDGLTGEIKGKASNEDWGARIASLILKSKKIDEDLAIVTSLDADSLLVPGFFHNLSYTFCTSPNRFQSGFQPIHSYSSNFFDTSLWPRQVATQTTLSNMTNLGISGETPFFAIYSVPLQVLYKVNFWEKELIAEDFLLFTKCLVKFDGGFQVYPFFGVFEGDAVIADDFIEEVIGQYKQLQRWAWGGVEAFPYMYKKFFIEPAGKNIPLRIRLRWIYLLFSNHFFWSSSPVLFSLGLFTSNIWRPKFSPTSNSSKLSYIFSIFCHH